MPVTQYRPKYQRNVFLEIGDLAVRTDLKSEKPKLFNSGLIAYKMGYSRILMH